MPGAFPEPLRQRAPRSGFEGYYASRRLPRTAPMSLHRWHVFLSLSGPQHVGDALGAVDRSGHFRGTGFRHVCVDWGEDIAWILARELRQRHPFGRAPCPAASHEAMLPHAHALGLRPFLPHVFDELHLGARSQVVETRLDDVVAGEVQLTAVRRLDERVAFPGEEPRHATVRRHHVLLHVAALHPDVLLEFAPGRVEGVAQGHVHVLRVLAIDHDLALAGTVHVDLHLEMSALVLVPGGRTTVTDSPGRDLHHTELARGIPGIERALATASRSAAGGRQLYFYVELAPGCAPEQVRATLMADPAVAGAEVLVFPVESVAVLEDRGHGVLLERVGTRAATAHETVLLEGRFDVRLVTARLMLHAVRQLTGLPPGAHRFQALAAP